MRTAKLPSTWYSTVPMNQPLSLVKSACFECFGARGFALGGGDEVSLTRSTGNALSVVSWVMGTANRVKGRAVVILSVDATHLSPQLLKVRGLCMATSPLPSRGPHSGESSIWGLQNG